MKKKDIFKSELVGGYLDRYNWIYLAVTSLIATFEIVMIIRGILIFDFNKITHVSYMISYVFLFLASVMSSVFLFVNRKHSLKKKYLSLVAYLYSFAIILWATIISYIDLLKANTPIVYLTIIIVVAGVVVINPLIYLGFVVLSFGSLMIGHIFNDFSQFSNSGYIVNLMVFIVMALIMAYRQYKVCEHETKIQENLKKISYTDMLTGLGNETAYIDHIQSIEENIRNNTAKFAVIVMDVNGVKITNDTYGHRFGCNLIVTGGHELQKVFDKAKVYHIGGDEYVAILEGDNISTLEESIKKFDDTLAYSMIEFENVEMPLSLARGYAVYESGMKYQDVFQKADDMMYENKIKVKKEHNIPSR